MNDNEILPMKKYNGFAYLQSTINLKASTKDEFICTLNKLKHFIIVSISEKINKGEKNGLTDDEIQSLYTMINELSVHQLDFEDLD